MKLQGHESLSAIQDLYPNPPVFRYHRIAPKIERGFGGFVEEINWLDMAIAFLLGYFIGGRNEQS